MVLLTSLALRTYTLFAAKLTTFEARKIMNTLARNCRPFFNRHKEAFFIVLFLLADFFLSGWALFVLTLVAVLYVVLPAIAQFRTLDAKAKIAFLKAFVKTPKVQKLGFLLFWLYSLRFFLYSVSSSKLLVFSTPHESEFSGLSTIFVFGPSTWAPLAYLASPFVFYGAACLLSIILRARLKSKPDDQDLRKQRKWWTNASQFLFMTAFISGILTITLNASGPSHMLSNWLLESARDSNLCNYPDPYPHLQQFSKQEPIKNEETNDSFDSSSGAAKFVPERNSWSIVNPYQVFQTADRFAPVLPLASQKDDLKFVYDFDNFIYCSSSLLVFLLLLQPALRLNSLLTSFSWRVVSARSIQNWIEAFLEALHLPARSLNLGEAHPVWTNAGKTLIWVSFCYLALLFLFGVCGGPLGEAIQNWMMCSVVDSFLAPGTDPPKWLFDPKLRLFLGSMVALYGAAPLAVTAAVFLPHTGARKIEINCDGLSFPGGPYLSLWGRQFRLWSDLKRFSVKLPADKNNKKAKFKIEFESGGTVSFNLKQMPARDMKAMLSAIDEYAPYCQVAPEIVPLIESLLKTEADGNSTHGDEGEDFSLQNESIENFKSTIFQQIEPGQMLPETEIRVIKLLASKALSAVYLARDEKGNMLVVKQFYLPDESDETKALEKTMMREYDLLSCLEHPGISKVLKSFSSGKSSFLLIEHRPGSDLRAIVEEHGPRSEAVVIAWAKQICRIMSYLHERQSPVLHRDLTPDNIIAGEDGQLRLIDFGAAREFLDGLSGTMIGKQCYMAPEQLRGQACIKSDIYSFGGTLFFLLTGRDPRALSQSVPSQSIACNESLDKLIADCTAFEQELRPESFAEILKRLNDFDKGLRISLKRKEERTLA